jgi:hypothetical protein
VLLEGTSLIAEISAESPDVAPNWAPSRSMLLGELDEVAPRSKNEDEIPVVINTSPTRSLPDVPLDTVVSVDETKVDSVIERL